MTVIILVLIVVGFLGIVGAVFANKVTKPRQIPYEETYRIEVENGRMDPEWFEKIEKEEVWIDSPYGYKLHGLLIPNDNSERAVIICHGITYSLFGSIKYAKIFHKLGFNIIVYDHRNHGKSGGTNTTLGYYEKHDLAAVKNWVLDRLGKKTRIGLHGESMGAAIAIQYLSLDDEIDFCVADCGFSDLEELLSIRLREDFHLPRVPFIWLARLFARIMTGADLKEVSPIRSVRETSIPIMFAHGGEDHYVSTFMSEKMYSERQSNKHLLIVPDAGHAMALVTDPAKYEKEIEWFLRSNDLL
ncbi:alpha/beta hydrolase [Mesotoga sp. HF07.pep.5.2.highcov]|uniref:alpha/beta hydrolase n=1 Tax=Mesotoga TaxID=1184396 RepID=UPI0002CA613F|nr:MULTISPECIES: alpha/beta hydrolase [Mesotoga]MCP5457969.1 alpha/beta hydrolase [Thermotogota bacterium]MDK2943847.1 uncharacterized protein [Mesotoga sp.]CCU85120.1 Alpha/beta hydrolase fold protein [Mesotoga infera]RLL90856.1 alpha/beta hydrolase [Mesotoga sp. HF07.pep.5.2.highcov]HPA00118.1 alpha/beta hydrolase [Mesotoga prima]